MGHFLLSKTVRFLLVFPGKYYLNFRYLFILQYKFLKNKQTYESKGN